MSTPRTSGESETGLGQDIAGEPSHPGFAEKHRGIAVKLRLLPPGGLLPGVHAGCCLSDRVRLATC